MESYSLSRYFWDFAFENPTKIKPVHCAIYFFAVEHCNRLGWKRNFGLPTSMVLEAIGIKSYSVYKSAFDDLVNYGLFEIIQYSKNQYSSNVIALKENYKANTKASTKALDKALQKHSTKHSQSTASINKQETIEQLTINKEAFLIIEFCKPFFEEKYLTKKTAELFDKLLNEYSAEKIKEAISNAKNDIFWAKNFLSPVKLNNKNKDQVKYIDVFLQLKKQTNGQLSESRRVNPELNPNSYWEDIKNKAKN